MIIDMWKVKAWSKKQQKEKQARQSGENSQSYK